MRATHCLVLLGLTLSISSTAIAQAPPRFSAQGVIYQSQIGGGWIAVDRSGNAYLLESSVSQVNGVYGAYVTKVDTTGRTLLYRTFVPAGGDLAIAADPEGNAYVVGTTATPGAIAATRWFGPHGDVATAVIAKLDTTGHLVYTSLAGGATHATYGLAIAADSRGNAYVTGITTAADYPTTPGAFERTHNGNNDAFLLKLDASGTSLLYSTFLGGTGQDDGYAIAADEDGTAFVGGLTWSAGFPTSDSAPQRNWGGSSDGFITAIDTVGGGLVYSSFVGGAGADSVLRLALGPDHAVAATGVTYSADFPTTAGAEQTQHGDMTANGADIFVLQLSPDGSTRRFSTFLGGDDWEYPQGLGISPDGEVVVAGRTASSIFPITPGAVHVVPDGPSGDDGFLASLDGSGRIRYSTYLGLGSQFTSFAMTLDERGDAYVTNGSLEAGFLLKLVPRAALPLTAVATTEESPALSGPASVDGDPWTRWSSDFSSPQWLIVDMHRRATVERIVINWETAFSTAYIIQVAEDGADTSDNGSWTTVFGTTTGDGGIDDLRNLAITGRYLRLVGQQRATQWGHSVWEFIAFGTPFDGANARPQVVLTAPVNGARFVAGSIVTVTADASDPDGTVSHVSFYLNGALLSDDAEAPYAASFAAASGGFTVGAVAYDDRGLASQPSIASGFISPPANPNLALGRPVLVSSVENAAFGGERAVDADPGTRWSSAFSDPQWIAIDLGTPTRIDSVVLSWEAAYATGFDIQVSNDAAAWTTIYSTETGIGGEQRIAGLVGTGRYVRMLGRQRATPWGYSLWEFAVYGLPINGPTTNIALGRSAFASSSEAAGLTPELATDGNGATRWSSAFADRQWIAIDLGSIYDISRVVLHWERAYALSYELQVSNDAVAWRSVRFVEQSDGGDDELTFASASARYVRMFAFARATEWGVSLWEFEVFGTPTVLTPNLARQAASIFASSTERPDTPAAAAADGNGETRWSSAFTDFEWLVVDLGQPFDLRRVVVNWEAAYASNYEVQVSDDGLSWRTLASTVTGDGGVDDFSVNALGRYVRVSCLARGTPWGYSIWELEVYGAH